MYNILKYLSVTTKSPEIIHEQLEGETVVRVTKQLRVNMIIQC